MFLSKSGYMSIGHEEGPNIVIETDNGVESRQFWMVEIIERRIVVAPLTEGDDDPRWVDLSDFILDEKPEDQEHADAVREVALVLEEASSKRTPSGNAIPVNGKSISDVLENR